MTGNSMVLQRALNLDCSEGSGPAVPDMVAADSQNAYTGLTARFFGSPESFRIIAFTSVSSGEGVTWTITRLASEIERTGGVRPIVVSWPDLVWGLTGRPDGILGAPAGFRPPDSQGLMSRLRSTNDVVLIDAGSLAKSGSAIGLSRVVDAVVLVVEAGKTRKKDVSRAIADITAAQGKIAGCVLNKSKAPLPAWLESMVG